MSQNTNEVKKVRSIRRSFSDGEITQLYNLKKRIENEHLASEVLNVNRDTPDNPRRRRVNQPPANKTPFESLMSSILQLNKRVDSGFKHMIEESKYSRYITMKLERELNELKEEMKGVKLKVQKRKTMKGDLYSVLYDYGTKRTEYTDNMKIAVDMYMEKVMKSSVRVEEAMLVGHEGDSQNYIYAKVTDGKSGGKLSIMCSVRPEGSKNKTPAIEIKRKRRVPSTQANSQQPTQSNSQPPSKAVKKEDKFGSVILDPTARTVVDFLLLGMNRNYGSEGQNN